MPYAGLGAWYDPEKNVSFHWDLEHSEPIAPHWDYIDEHHNFFRIYKDGRIELTPSEKIIIQELIEDLEKALRGE